MKNTSNTERNETTGAPPLSSIALLAKEDRSSTLDLVAAPIPSSQAVAIINAAPLATSAPDALRPAPPAKRKIRRHGRVASLPKLQRDMVNRMLWNGVPYKNIVEALSECGYTLIERNISNWATDGYLEWRLEQEAVHQNRLDQDHLLDFLRRDDAPELPEVGLQAAATRLSQVLLQKLAHADDPEAHMDNYTKLIDLLCRLNREIATTQKVRDDSRRTLGKAHDPVRIKNTDEGGVIEMERFYSNPPDDAELPKPASPAFVPAIPTSEHLDRQDLEERHEAQIRQLEERNAMMKALLGKSAPTAPTPPLSK
jgi:hypothetical protein